MSSSVSDLLRTWLQRQLGLSSSAAASSSISDLENLLYAQAGIASNRQFASGRYYDGDQQATITTGALTVGTAYFIPFVVGIRAAFNSIGFETTVVGTAGSLTQVGLYSSDSSGLPSTLLATSGSVDTATAIGVKETAISVTLDPGLYWLALLPLVASPTYRIKSNTSNPYVAPTAFPAGNAVASHTQTGLSGLPATAAIASFSNAAPRVTLKAA